MNKIEVKVLNPEAISSAGKMMVCAARLTQSGHKIKNMQDFMDLYEKPYTCKTYDTMVNLPHPTIQKFGVINVVIVGASRRFLAQITRHQNEVKFMSASLQYSDYTDEADFVVPYNILNNPTAKLEYLQACKHSMIVYKDMVRNRVDHDEAGYAAPQGLRNILIISATPYQWKHMIRQRICRRNTLETRYVMLLIWKELWKYDNQLFSINTTAPLCVTKGCPEGKFCCGNYMSNMTPDEIIKEDFPNLEVKDE